MEDAAHSSASTRSPRSAVSAQPAIGSREDLLQRRLQRYFDRYGIDATQQQHVVEIFTAMSQSTRNGLRDEDPWSEPVIKEHFLQRERMVAKLAEEVGPENAVRLAEARISLPYQTAIVNDFVRRCLEAGQPVSQETADDLAVALYREEVYVRIPKPASLPPSSRRPLTPEQISRYSVTDEKALHTVAPLLTPGQLQHLKQLLEARYSVR